MNLYINNYYFHDFCKYNEVYKCITIVYILLQARQFYALCNSFPAPSLYPPGGAWHENPAVTHSSSPCFFVFNFRFTYMQCVLFCIDVCLCVCVFYFGMCAYRWLHTSRLSANQSVDGFGPIPAALHSAQYLTHTWLCWIHSCICPVPPN